MRLITHNMLRCNKRGVENGFPLAIEPREVEQSEADFNAEFIVSMLDKLEWRAFAAAAVQLGLEPFPAELAAEMKSDEAFLRRVHHALLEVHVVEGELVCPESGRRFPISNSIPNMLLNEDEV